MYTVIVIVHVLACLALIVVVLLQKGKGADLGAAFGGSSQTVFGSQGAGGFFTKLVGVAVAIFMMTSLSLAYMSSHRVQATVMEETKKSDAAAPAESGQEGVPVEKEAPPADSQEAPAPEATGQAAPAPQDAGAGGGGS